MQWQMPKILVDFLNAKLLPNSEPAISWPIALPLITLQQVQVLRIIRVLTILNSSTCNFEEVNDEYVLLKLFELYFLPCTSTSFTKE